jgi:hypothetical protein
VSGGGNHAISTTSIPVASIAEILFATIAGHSQSKIDDLMPQRFRKNVKPAINRVVGLSAYDL